MTSQWADSSPVFLNAPVVPRRRLRWYQLSVDVLVWDSREGLPCRFSLVTSTGVQTRGGVVTELLPAAWPPAREPAQGSLEACWPPLFPDSWQLRESAARKGATQLGAGLRRAQCLVREAAHPAAFCPVFSTLLFCFLHKKQGQQTSKLKNFPLVSLNKNIEIPKLTPKSPS